MHSDTGIVFKYLAELNLSYNFLSGSIPPLSVGDLINLSHNQLTSTIPLLYGYNKENITSEINVSYNLLTGNIPDYLLHNYSLSTLNLSHNQLTGSIPAPDSALYNNPYFNLYEINLSYNQLSGNIPVEIAKLKNLGILILDSNNLSGHIPAEFAKSQYLITLSLSNNRLSGRIPNFGSYYYEPRLRYLYLHGNYLSDSLPFDIGNLTNLRELDVSKNKLTGKLPRNVGNWRSLLQLSLNDNKFTGPIPPLFDSITNLISLKLQHNQLSGSIPSLKNLVKLQKLSLRENAFTFNGLEPVQQQFGNIALYYDQAIISLHQHSNTLAVTAGGTLSNNTYIWYKDGTAYATHTGDSTLSITEGGSYYVSVTNAVATGLTLYSDTLTVSGFNKPAASIALYPNPAKSNATALFNATGNYTLILSNASGKVLQTISGTSNKEQNKVDFNISTYPQGMYFISIKDEKETRLLKLTKE